MSGGGTATESATIPEDISGRMLELDEDEDLEVFSKKADGTCRTDFKKTHSREDVTQVFKDFVSGNGKIISSYIRRLDDIRQALKASDFFMKHEVIGSSLLFIHDHTERAEVWLIDFGKTTALPDGQMLDHNKPWHEGNREDGYLWGFDNLLHTLSSLPTQCS